jgi:hypothetical protein
VSRVHAGTTFCYECGVRRACSYDLDTDETVCNHCRTAIIPLSGHLTEAQRGRLRTWKATHRPDAGPHR